MPRLLITIGANRLPGRGTLSDVFDFSASRTLLVKRGIVITGDAKATFTNEPAGDLGALNKFATVTDAAGALHTATFFAQRLAGGRPFGYRSNPATFGTLFMC
jgi:hypothetical protein